MNQGSLKKPVNIDELLDIVVSKNGSDLHLSKGLPPTIRILEILQPIPGYGMLESEEIASMIKQILKKEQYDFFEKEREFDFSYTLGDKARFRVNVFFASGHYALAARLIPIQIPDFAALGLPSILQEFCKLPQGLVLVTGPTGVGKSSTLAAMINWINNNRNAHIITVEDPIEYLFSSNKSLIQQREMNIDTYAWDKALRSSLREDPDILLIGEMRDRETVSAALQAAETGHLVLATLHTNSAAQTIDRIIGIFPEHNQTQVRLQLSAVLEGVISQTLVRSADKTKRYPALELLIANPAVKNTVREGKTHFIDNIINTNFDLGMSSLERSLADLVSSGKVDLDEALSKTLKPDDIVRYTQQAMGKSSKT